MKLEVKQLVLASKAIATEKNLPEDIVKDAIEQALAAAYRKDFGDREQEVRAVLNQNTGAVDFFVKKEVADNVEDEFTQISVDAAKDIKKDAKPGDEVEIKDAPQTFGRVAAQTAKQVLMQRLRESEREAVLGEYEDKIGSVLNGTVSRVEQRLVRVDLGKAQGILPKSEQIQGEYYSTGQRIKVYLKEVERSNRGPQLILSRANTEFIEYLFASEVPEMENGAVEIKAIAREAGIRTKIAVYSTVPGVDPVGTFVGGHGTRVQAVMSEVGDQEKIDIIPWDGDDVTFIANALAPTEVDNVELKEKEKTAIVTVRDDQLSIAIGKGGQNVRLASKLTGWEIDVKSQSGGKPAESEEQPKEAESKPRRLASKAQLEESLLSAVEEHGEDQQESEQQNKEKDSTENQSDGTQDKSQEEKPEQGKGSKDKEEKPEK